MLTHNREHLELLSHLIFSQCLLYLPFIHSLCPQVMFDYVIPLIFWHRGSLWSKCDEFKRSKLPPGGPRGRERHYLLLYSADSSFSLASTVPLLPFSSVFLLLSFTLGFCHVQSVSRKNPKPKARPMLCSVSLRDWLLVPSDKSLIPWSVCFCILPKICEEACCTWFNFLRTKLIWSSHPGLCVALSLHFH